MTRTDRNVLRATVLSLVFDQGLTRAEAAARSGVPAVTVYRWCAAHEGVAYGDDRRRLAAGLRRSARDELDRRRALRHAPGGALRQVYRDSHNMVERAK